MSDWNQFYEATEKTPAEATLGFACDRVSDELPKVAIDCGCGGGRNTPFLRSRGFEVHGFDPDAQGIERCRNRFADDNQVFLSCESFTSFDYPSASLVLASYSLFFCPVDDFDQAWSKIKSSIVPGGVFCGTFLGKQDSWAMADSDRKGRGVISHTLDEIQALLTNFDIEETDIKNFDGVTATGTKKHWHAITMVARKRAQV